MIQSGYIPGKATEEARRTMDDDPKDLFKRAAELAAVVPEAMQPTAFNRALDLLLGGEPGTNRKPARRRDPQRASVKGKPKHGDEPARPKQKVRAGADQRAGSTRGRPGPKVMLDGLIDSGFFAKAKTGAEVIEYEKKHRGHTYKPTDLSPALVRLLRDGRLEREKNKDGIYEYIAR